MTLLDRLLLVVFVVLFVWQVALPMAKGRPAFPLLRSAKKGRK